MLNKYFKNLFVSLYHHVPIQILTSLKCYMTDNSNKKSGKTMQELKKKNSPICPSLLFVYIYLARTVGYTLDVLYKCVCIYTFVFLSFFFLIHLYFKVTCQDKIQQNIF